MSDTPPDDDRTVVRPSTLQRTMKVDPPEPSAPAEAPAAVPPDDDRTVVRPTTLQRTMKVDPPEPFVPATSSLSDDGGNALPIGTFMDEFELRSVAGEGGFSIVYRAWDHSLNRQVAVKEYMPSGLAARGNGSQVSVRSERHRETFEAGLRSFVEEARLLAHFDHPALIKVYRFWKANGSAYMVMPFCEGTTLRDQWRADPEPPDEMALLTLLEPLTEALAVLHAEHWYHRDIAPDNVMILSGTNRPLLLDFGAARQVIGDMTHALTVILKPGYAPIEQWGEVPGMKQGPWTDVYALAAMIHFAITRKTPPPSVGRLVNDNYEPLETIAAGRYSPHFLAAIDRALAVRPENRTPSIDHFRAEIGLGPTLQSSSVTLQVPMPGEAGGATQRLGDLSQPTARWPQPTVMQPTLQAGGATARLPTPVPLPDGRTEQRVPEPAPQPGGSKSTGLLIGGVVALAAAGIGAYLVFGHAPAPAPAPVAAAPAPAPTPAPEPAPPPAPAPAPLTTFDVASQFNRVTQAQTPGYLVEVTLPKSTLRSEQDEVHFSVRSQRDGFVYVYSYGTDGELIQLYPHGNTKPKIRAGQTVEFGKTDRLLVVGPAGVNPLLVMVSNLPREHPGFPPLKVEDGYSYFPTGAAAAALAARHTGPLPIMAGSAVCPAGGSCVDEFGAAVVTFNVAK